MCEVCKLGVKRERLTYLRGLQFQGRCMQLESFMKEAHNSENKAEVIARAIKYIEGSNEPKR